MLLCERDWPCSPEWRSLVRERDFDAAVAILFKEVGHDLWAAAARAEASNVSRDQQIGCHAEIACGAMNERAKRALHALVDGEDHLRHAGVP